MSLAGGPLDGGGGGGGHRASLGLQNGCTLCGGAGTQDGGGLLCSAGIPTMLHLQGVSNVFIIINK